MLAAGEGKRMGFPKALLAFDETRTLLDAVAATFRAAGCDVLAVFGCDAEKLRKRHREIDSIVNRSWQQGQFSSVKAGLRAALQRGANQILIHPVDVPKLKLETLSFLLGASRGVPAAVPEAGGVRGHPLIVNAAIAARILTMPNVDSLEDASRRLDIIEVPVTDPGVLLNINTPQEYQSVFGRAPRMAGAAVKGTKPKRARVRP